jgi:hypothetical protein
MSYLKLISLFFYLNTTIASPDCVDCNTQTDLTPSTPTSTERAAISTAGQLLNRKFKGMLTKNRCEIFKKSMTNINNEHHLIPSQALFDSLSYFFNNKGQSPRSKKGEKLLEESGEFIKIAKECRKKRKKNGYISWKTKKRGKIKKSCKTHLEGLGFHQNLIRDHEANLTNPLITIGNFDVESDMKRFFVINSETGEISASKVSHGGGSKDAKNQSRRLRKCKTRRGSTKDQTRPGFYKVTSRVLKGHKKKKARYKGSYLIKGWPTACHEGTYNPRARRTKCGKGSPNSFFNALRIVGLEDSNDDAYSSGVVMHGASYNPPSPDGLGVAGASQGCPAFSYKDFERIGQSLTTKDSEGSSLYYSYAPVCGEIERDSGKRVSRISKFKKELSSNYKKIKKKLKKILGKEYLKEFNAKLKAQGFRYEHFASINPKYAKSWGRKLKNHEVISTLDYLKKLVKSLESSSPAQKKEGNAIKYIKGLLSPGNLTFTEDESPFINQYIQACKRI